MDDGSAVHGVRSVRVFCVRPRLAHRAADARAHRVFGLLPTHAGAPGRVEGAHPGGSVPEGRKSVGWALLRPTAIRRTLLTPTSTRRDGARPLQGRPVAFQMFLDLRGVRGPPAAPLP